VVADEVVGDGGPAADARAEPGVSTPRVGAPAPAAPGPRGDGFQQHGQGRRGKHRRSGRSNFPRVPDGPPGLVYVVDSSSPIGATGSLRVYYRQVAQGGATVLHPVPVDRQMSRRSQHPLDHRVASVLIRLPKQGKNYIRTKRGWRGKKGRGRRHGWQMDQRAVTVTEKTWRTLLPWLVESQRFYLALPGSNETVPIVREELSPLEFHLLIERIRKRGDFHLTCRFLRGSRTLLYKSQVLLVTEGERGWLLRRSGKMSNVDFSGSVAWLRALRRGRFRHVPRRKVSSLLKIFERSTTLPPVHFPSSLKVTRLEGYLPRPELKLESGPQEVTGEVTFRYGEDVVRAARPGKRFFSLKNRRLIERDLKVEAEHAVELLQHGFTYDNNTHGFSLSADLLATAAPQLFELGWTLHGKRMPFRPPTDMDVDVTTGPDYIDVSVTVHFGDQKVELPQLLQAMREGSRMIVLGQGAVGVLPGEWLDRNAGWMELGKLHEGKLRFRRNQSALIDALAADKIRARLDKGFKAERERLANFEGIHECEPPEGFKGTLRPYQKFGLGWLRFLDQMAWGGCLADDMGLGKTVQALALLLHVKNEGRTGTTLIVTPKSLIFNWLREAKRFTPKLKVTSYTGPKRHSLFDSLSSYDIVLTTYGTVRRDAEKLAGVSFFYLILDEAQAIKNADSQNAKAASLLSGERRLILSGTPVENHLGELWSLFDFINPGMLGTYSAFRKRFGGDRGIDSSSLAFLRRTLRPFILRRKKEEVATDLPPRVEETIMCELDEEQKKVYAEVKERCRNSVLRHVKAQGMARSKLHILEALLRMRQAACHPALISEEYANVSSGKIGAALSMLDEIEDAGHKALVFSQFTSLLAIVRKELEAKGKKLGRDYEYLDGQTRNRGERVDHFQGDPDCRFFLISLKAGGLGLNLTAADYVFILDPWWNPAVEAQAIDRAHRIGQEKKVFAYRFVSQESIEERIAELQESKRKLADAIVSEDDSLIRDLTKEDLEVLFS
jgi:superfamily II DNA or RNA helicase